jgi:flagellar protein FlgJ
MKIDDPLAIGHATRAAHEAGQSTAPNAEALHAARQFEQIFLRKMLSVLEKTGRPGNGGAATAGSDVYSSMVVNALAEAISSGGGIGLADVIARSLVQQGAAPTAPASPTPGPAAQPGTQSRTPEANGSDATGKTLTMPGRR